MCYKALLIAFCIFPCWLQGQPTQTLRGKVVDKETQAGIWAASVQIDDLDPAQATLTDSSGIFLISNIPLGKRNVVVTSLGYHGVQLKDVLFTSGKEVVLQVELEERMQTLNEVVIAAQRRKDVLNEMALVSARRFDVQETERFAGSRGDPARMASNYAGVQGADDSRNDIIVRGNSPQGILWRLEDIDIPNPNHFAVPGTSGGPVSIINNKTLGNSDFFTGAFPAEYGNATGGVFDLKMRNGNPARHEVSAQLGFLGTELALEGPLSSQRKASYLFTYRYSTLKLFEGLNIRIGTSSVPNYQDGALKLNFPLGKKSNLSVFGIGGISHIDLIVSNLKEPSEELYGEDDRDQYFSAKMGVAGAAFQTIFSKQTLFKLVVARTYSETFAHHDKVFRNMNFDVDSLKNILDYNSLVHTTVAHAFVNHKLNAAQTLKLGIMNTLYQVNFVDSSRQYPPTLQEWQHRSNYQGATNLLQPYIQYKWRATERLTATAGVHGQWLSHNQSFAVEPRLAVRYQLYDRSLLSLGYGLHSQSQPLYQYYTHLPQYPAAAMHNFNTGFTRSHHLVAGYDQGLMEHLRLKVEAYYQYLFHIPIETRVGSSFSGLNQGASFSRLFPDTLVNKGTGYNYGLELTLEKGFQHGFYALFTGALYDSRAKGNDGVFRNTDYNGHFALNILGGYEFKLGKRGLIISGLKITYAGGRLYSPPDINASNALGDLVVIDSLRNTLRFPDYFRMDLKLGYRYNAARMMHEIGLDLVNILNTRNVLTLVYSPDLAAQGKEPFVQQYQLGFLPLFYYRVDFGYGKKG